MKNFKTLALSLGLTTLLMACGSKKEGGDSQPAPAPAPIQPAVAQAPVIQAFDNSYGRNPRTSIQGTAIRNLTLGLRDENEGDSGYSIRLLFNFDGAGVLNVDATLDTDAFNSNDPWSYQNNNGALTSYRATNIPYSYNKRTGAIQIRNFYAGSTIVAQATTTTTLTPAPGQPPVMTSTNRKGISVNAINIHQKSNRFFKVEMRTNAASNGTMSADLINLDTGELLDSSHLSSGFAKNSAGFSFTTQIQVSGGEIVSAPNFIMNGTQQTQVMRESFMRNPYGASRTSFVYQAPVLDPRIQ